MLGEKVVVLTRKESGKDNLDEPIYAWDEHEVEGVLVRPLSGREAQSDPSDEGGMDGIRIQYSLAFPKAYSGPSLESARIALVDRGMSTKPEDALLVSGKPDIVRPCPTKWNMKVSVGRIYG